LFGLVLGYCPLMRQSALQVPAACVFIVGVGGIAAALTYFLRRKGNVPKETPFAPNEASEAEQGQSAEADSEWAFCRYARPLVCFFAFFLVVRLGGVWLWSAMYEK